MTSKPVGLLWDSVSNNIGDQAIGLAMKRFFESRKIRFETVDPFNINIRNYSTIIIGGGELIRNTGDLFYDLYRVPGNNILNVVGTHHPSDMDYLQEYSLISVRSKNDKKELLRLVKNLDVDVKPCTTVLMHELFPELEISDQKKGLNDPVIGVHVHAAALQALPNFIEDLARINKKYKIVLFPFTLYQNDEDLLRTIQLYLSNATIYSSIDPLEVFKGMNEIDLMISTSLHAGIFSYILNKQILSFPVYQKISNFFIDRNLGHFLFTKEDDLLERVETLFSQPVNYEGKVKLDKKQAINHLYKIEEIIRKQGQIQTKVKSKYFFVQKYSDVPQLYHSLTHSNIKTSVALMSKILELEVLKTTSVKDIFEKDEVIKRLEQHNEEFKIRVIEKDLEISSINNHIVKLIDEITSLTSTIDKYVWDLDQINSSKAYRMALFIRNIRYKIFPKNLQGRVRGLLGINHILGRERKSQIKEKNYKLDDGKFVYHLETEIPNQISVGKGSYLLLKGWCFHTKKKIKKIEIRVDQRIYKVKNFSFVREDVLTENFYRFDKVENILHSGFWIFIPFKNSDVSKKIEIEIIISIRNGKIYKDKLGEIFVSDKEFDKIDGVLESTKALPLVTICMATYNPQLDLFKDQISSIINQTYSNWICIINDDCSQDDIFNEIVKISKSDSRFYVFRNEARLGHYYNFERSLLHVPNESQYIAFCDQDDLWYSEKISKSLEGFRNPDVQLTFCDMDIVDSKGIKLANTFWTTRKNNYKSLETMVYANTVTGAATLIRASLLKDILPFPQKISDQYHDHWVGCVALTKGKIKYIDESLYAYIQHTQNAYGMQGKTLNYTIFPELRKILKSKGIFSSLKYDFRETVQYLDQVYFSYLLKILLIVKTLLLRLPPINIIKRANLNTISTGEKGGLGLVLESFKYEVTRRPSLGYEHLALRSFIGHHFKSWFYKNQLKQKILKTKREIDIQISHPNNVPIENNIIDSKSTDDNMVNLVERMIAPLSLSINEQESQRVNIIMATVDFKYIFGGYLAMFNLALNIKKLGYKPRIVIVEPCDFNPGEWSKQIKSYPGLENLFDDVEFSYHFDRSIPLFVNPRDKFIATSCWTAYIAHRAAEDLGNSRFVFFAQEYEPIFFQMSSLHALSHQSYLLSQFTIFSTELLKEYFKINHIGIFEKSIQEGERNSMVFRNAIASFSISKKELLNRTIRKFLFYARPESHAARNMYELGILGLKLAIRSGSFNNKEWEFFGIGTIGNNRKINLGNNKSLLLLPKVSLKEYIEILPNYDLGMSLMLSPHPSLVPLEMAAAGLTTITNTFANKNPDILKSISTNLIAVPPTIEGIAEGLIKGSEVVNDIDCRIKGANVNWPTRWDDAFDKDFNNKIISFLS